MSKFGAGRGSDTEGAGARNTRPTSSAAPFTRLVEMPENTPSAATNDPRRWWHAELDKLWQAEYAARVCEQECNEGDADAIRRDAIRSILGLGIGDEMYATRKLQEKHRGL